MTEPLGFTELLECARSTKSDLEDRLRRQALERPEWTRSIDARAAGLQSLWNVLRFAELSLVFVDWHLSDAEWWVRLRGQRPSLREITFEYTAYTQGSKFGVFHLASASFENVLRALLRAIAPGAANDGRAEFKSVYECLLRTHLRFPDDDLALLELLRLTRNTIHNEGQHRPPGAKSASVKYRGVTYAFPESGNIEFVTWHFVIQRIGDLVELLDRIVRAEPLWGHRGHILADWADVLPRSAA